MTFVLPEFPEAEDFADLDPQLQERIKIVARKMHLLAYQFSVPLTFFRSDGDDWTVNNATASVVRTESGPFGLTADHVLTDYEDWFTAGDVLEVQLASSVVDIDPSTARRWKENDLAAVPLTEETVNEIDGWIYDLRGRRESPVPEPGAYVLVVGFPEYSRVESKMRIVDHNAQGALLRVTQSGDHHFSCQFERDEWIDAFGRGIVEPGTWMGGLSGAPVLFVGNLHFPLVGIVSEFVAGSSIPGFEVLRLESTEPLLALNR